eukprot:6478247-Amphidinium_carterae.1
MADGDGVTPKGGGLPARTRQVASPRLRVRILFKGAASHLIVVRNVVTSSADQSLGQHASENRWAPTLPNDVRRDSSSVLVTLSPYV